MHLKLLITSAAALCSVQARLTSGLGNSFESKCIKSPRCPENMGQLVICEPVQVRIQLPRGKNPPPWLGCSYLLAVENIITLLSAKAAYLFSLLYLRYLLESVNRNNLKQNNNVPV